MAGGQRLISWLHPCSTSNVALNTRTSAHGPLMGHPNWAGCDTFSGFLLPRLRRSLISVAGMAATLGEVLQGGGPAATSSSAFLGVVRRSRQESEVPWQ
jgi:hypothetical protein